MNDAGHKPVVIGLAGGIGSGKSAVAKLLGELGALVSDSDTEAKAVLDLPEVFDQIKAWWGSGVLDSGGKVDRVELARIIFSDPVQRERLEGLTHPLVHRQRAELIEQATRDGVKAVVIDAPLLFEADVDGECDAVIFVDCPREKRLKRVGASRGWDEGEMDLREAAQMPLEDKRARSHAIITNDGDLEALAGRVEKVYRELILVYG